MNLREYRHFIDTEMFEILGQMDAPSKIQDYLYLGSEWNASNIEELQNNGYDHGIYHIFIIIFGLIAYLLYMYMFLYSVFPYILVSILVSTDNQAHKNRNYIFNT